MHWQNSDLAAERDLEMRSLPWLEGCSLTGQPPLELAALHQLIISIFAYIFANGWANRVDRPADGAGHGGVRRFRFNAICRWAGHSSLNADIVPAPAEKTETHRGRRFHDIALSVKLPRDPAAS